MRKYKIVFSGSRAKFDIKNYPKFLLCVQNAALFSLEEKKIISQSERIRVFAALEKAAKQKRGFYE